MSAEPRPEIQILIESIEAEESNISMLYERLAQYAPMPETEEQTIAAAYYLNNLYSAFEQICLLVARTFENRLDDPSKWHSQLLQRMKLDIEGIRPKLLSNEAFALLDRLRSFRHVFRNAYVIKLDPEEIAILVKKASQLQEVYQSDLAEFKSFLESLK